MIYKEWEQRFLKTLKPLNSEERERLKEYYREIYEEKLSEGKTEEIILEELGSPESTAYRILAENSEQITNGPEIQESKFKYSVKDKSIEYIGLVFLSLFLIIPLSAVAVAVVVSLGAVSVSGVAISVAGVLGIIALPFLGAGSASAVLGVLIALIGVGLLLFVSFYYLTKYSGILLYKCLKSIYTRSKLWKTLLKFC